MPEQIDLSFAIGLSPEKAVEYFRAKGYTISWDWYETWQEANSYAFTVSKVTRLDILRDIKTELQKALDDGLTLQQFRKNLDPILQSKGWWGQGQTESGQVVQMGSPWRLQLIYNQNIQSAYNAGRWEQQMANADARPYLQYVAVMDSVTRPAHARLDGLVFWANDPFWKTHYPPNGWGCRCSVRALSAADVKRLGLTVISSAGLLQENEVLASGRTGEVVPVTVFKFRNEQTGEIITMAPDPGFNYNPGMAAWKPDLSKYPPDLMDIYNRYLKENAV
ncbi:MAG: phage minor head protein [Candidatus Edwardsbacteria bacterium]|nr:phage minor head protein [Candidatus Edwardsbacteria bacterium]